MLPLDGSSTKAFSRDRIHTHARTHVLSIIYEENEGEGRGGDTNTKENESKEGGGTGGSGATATALRQASLSSGKIHTHGGRGQ